MIRIVTDSVASIPAELARENDIEVLSLFVNRDGVEYADAEMDLDAFYTDIQQMVDDIPTSSQPSQLAFETAFAKAAEAGDSVLGIFISTGLSGTYEGALRAARAVKANHIDFEYRLIDSASCGYDEAWPVWAAVDARNEGKDLDGCAQAVLSSIEGTRFLFTPESLTFLHKGGRIGAAAALVGNLIQLTPIITVSEGKVEVFAKVRTRKKALDKIVAKLKEDMDACELKNIMVHYIGDKAPAVAWARDIIVPLVGHEVPIAPVSPVIGLHVGPAIGIAYECAKPLPGKISTPAKGLVCAS